MPTIEKVRPYSFTKLLGSSLLGQESRAKFERGVSEKTATLLGQGPVPNSGVLIPPAQCAGIYSPVLLRPAGTWWVRVLLASLIRLGHSSS